MRHYEVVVILNPNQSDQAHSTINHYKAVIEEGKGKIHRYEDWGRRILAYPINKLHKGHYMLFNIEVNQETLDRLNTMFRYNDAVMRYVFIKKDSAVTEASPIKKELENNRTNKYKQEFNRASGFGTERLAVERNASLADQQQDIQYPQSVAFEKAE